LPLRDERNREPAVEPNLVELDSDVPKKCFLLILVIYLHQIQNYKIKNYIE